eukprot:scaffold114510_cov27-Tisochrysis_lutea.AAC.1
MNVAVPYNALSLWCVLQSSPRGDAQWPRCTKPSTRVAMRTAASGLTRRLLGVPTPSISLRCPPCGTCRASVQPRVRGSPY